LDTPEINVKAFIDTNILTVGSDINLAGFQEVKKLAHALKDNVSFFLADVTARELAKQLEDRATVHGGNYEKIKKFAKQIYGIDLKLPRLPSGHYEAIIGLAASHGLAIAPFDVTKVTLAEVLEEALAKRGIFSGSDAGFKDFLIVRNIQQNVSKDAQMAIITSDGKMQDHIRGFHPEMRIFSSLEEFESQIKLERAEADKARLDRLKASAKDALESFKPELQRIVQKAYDRQYPGGLAVQALLPTIPIREEWSGSLVRGEPYIALGAVIPPGNWHRAIANPIRFSEPLFESRGSGDESGWKTDIIFEMPYDITSPDLSSVSSRGRIIHLVEYQASWSLRAGVSPEAALSFGTLSKSKESLVYKRYPKSLFSLEPPSSLATASGLPTTPYTGPGPSSQGFGGTFGNLTIGQPDPMHPLGDDDDLWSASSK
jgi:hypothetical protein